MKVGAFAATCMWACVYAAKEKAGGDDLAYNTAVEAEVDKLTKAIVKCHVTVTKYWADTARDAEKKKDATAKMAKMYPKIGTNLAKEAMIALTSKFIPASSRTACKAAGDQAAQDACLTKVAKKLGLNLGPYNWVSNAGIAGYHEFLVVAMPRDAAELKDCWTKWATIIGQILGKKLPKGGCAKIKKAAPSAKAEQWHKDCKARRTSIGSILKKYGSEAKHAGASELLYGTLAVTGAAAAYLF